MPDNPANRPRSLSPIVQAAVDADLSGDVLRGVLGLFDAVMQGLDARCLPPKPHSVIASLCEGLTQWRVVGAPLSPYVHIRKPIDADGVEIVCIDLRRIAGDEPCPRDTHREAWAKVIAAAKTYREQRALMSGVGGNA